MKRNILIVALLMLISVISFRVSAQTGNMEDVVYLKNGSIIHGTIIEQVPNESLKIKTKDGSVFVYNMAEVTKMAKEQVAVASSSSLNSYSENQYTNINIPSYKQIKMNYNTRMYVSQPTDPYNPAISGLCSWLIPGLGQMICGETSRGLGFLGGYAGCYIVMGVGSVVAADSYEDGAIIAGSLLTIVGAVGLLTVDIWSIVDAVKVAKVKNMYVSDMRKNTSSFHLEVAPYMDQISLNNEIVRPVGLTMRVRF
jgi:hypothetical protein